MLCEEMFRMGVGGFQIHNKTNSGLQQNVDSPQCWGDGVL